MAQVLLIAILVIIVIIIILFILLKETEEEPVIEEKPSLPSIDSLEKETTFKKMMKEYQKEEKDLWIPLGYDEEGKIQGMDLRKENNILVVGTTGGGKSICLNEIISALLMKYTEEDMKFLTIDTSIVELSSFNGIPHYIKDTIMSPQEVTEELESLRKEIKRRKGIHDAPILMVIIDDLYDICSEETKKNQKLLEQILEENKDTNVFFILATDTPTKEVLTDRLMNSISGRIYLTLSPGEKKSFDLEKKLKKEDIEYISEIGNMVFIKEDEKKHIKAVEVLEEDIKTIVDFYKN